MLPDDPPVAGAGHTRRLDELPLAQRQHLRPHDPSDVEPVEDPDHRDQRHGTRDEEAADGDARQPVADREPQRHDEEQDRKAHREFRRAREDDVHPAAVEAGDGAHERSDHEREQRRAERHLERRAAAGEEPQELVAAERTVGAEDEQRLAVPRDRRVRGVDVRPGADRLQIQVDRAREEGVGPVPEHALGEGEADEAGADDEEDEQAARERDAVSAQAPPGQDATAGRQGDVERRGGRSHPYSYLHRKRPSSGVNAPIANWLAGGLMQRVLEDGVLVPAGRIAWLARHRRQA
jgi:hypothetical protein